MKIAKKISALFLTLCLSISCFSMVVLAADTRISFSDPSTKVGDMVDIKCAVRSDSETFSDVEISVTYDQDYLSFKSGDNVEKDGDSLKLSSTSSGSDIEFTMTFQALKEGSTKVTIGDYTVTNSSGTNLTCDEGSSSVTIAAGDPSKIEEDTSSDDTASSGSGATVQVQVQGVDIPEGTMYTLTGDFPDSVIPVGYARTSVSIEGEDIDMLSADGSGATLGYLIDNSDNGDFYLYDSSDATFWPYEEVPISEVSDTTIIILSDTSSVDLPESYQEATLTLNEKKFPVWQDTESDGFYVLYALSSAGNQGYYQYDPTEGTYQRCEIENPEEEGPDTSTILGKIEDLLSNHLPLFILVAGLAFILLFIILIVVAVKLHNRNAELDDLYDEYGIDEEPEPEPEPVSRKDKKKDKKNKKNGGGGDEDDFSEDDDFTEQFFKDEDLGGEEDTEDFTTGSFDSVPVDDEVFEGYEEHEELTLDDLWGEDAKKNKKQSHQEDDDTFKVDFIDLD